jgi:hypothetical protein
MTQRGKTVQIDRIPDDLWKEAAAIVIKEIRTEMGIPNWLPKFMNGRDEFEARVIALSSQGHSQARQLGRVTSKSHRD